MLPSVMRRELGFEELAFSCAIASPGPTLKPMLMFRMKSELERCIYPPLLAVPASIPIRITDCGVGDQADGEKRGTSTRFSTPAKLVAYRRISRYSAHRSKSCSPARAFSKTPGRKFG